MPTKIPPVRDPNIIFPPTQAIDTKPRSPLLIWPPTIPIVYHPSGGFLLSDHNAPLVLMAEIPGKERGARWPDNFSCKGWSRDVGFGEPARMQGEDGDFHYLVQGRKWILFGQEGTNAGLAKKLAGGSKLESAVPKFSLGPKRESSNDAL